MLLKCFSLATPDVQPTAQQAHTFLVPLHQPTAEPDCTISSKLWGKYINIDQKTEITKDQATDYPSGCFTAWYKFFQEVSKPLRTTKLWSKYAM